MINAAVAYDIAKSFNGDLKRAEREIQKRAKKGKTDCVVFLSKRVVGKF